MTQVNLVEYEYGDELVYTDVINVIEREIVLVLFVIELKI